MSGLVSYESSDGEDDTQATIANPPPSGPPINRISQGRFSSRSFDELSLLTVIRESRADNS